MDIKEIYETLKAMLPESVSLDIIEGDEKPSVRYELLGLCLEERSIKPFINSFSGRRYQSAMDLLSDMLDEVCSVEEQKEFVRSDYYEDIVGEILNRNDFKNEREFFVNSENYGKFVLVSNYDLFAPVGYTDGRLDVFHYVGSLMDVLNLNPSSLRRELNACGVKTSGEWPSMNERKGKNAFRYKDIARLISNVGFYSSLTFVGKIDMGALWSVLSKGKSVEESAVIPKGTKAVMFNDLYGEGTSEVIATTRDIVVKDAIGKSEDYDKIVFRLDFEAGKYDYSTEQAYGEYLSDNVLFFEK